jgi:hypothetical protein
MIKSINKKTNKFEKSTAYVLVDTFSGTGEDERKVYSSREEAIDALRENYNSDMYNTSNTEFDELAGKIYEDGSLTEWIEEKKMAQPKREESSREEGEIL